ncbi:MAG: metallophosphoesterase family protein [Acidimicrobiales bacterium]
MTRLVIVSDSHLSPRTPEADTNWTAIIDHLAIGEPALVVHAGDISLDGANRGEDLEHAKAQLDRLEAPWRAIPGNHDVGETHDAAASLVEARRASYEALFGDRSWTVDLDGWRLIGIDSQELLNSEAGAEAAWAWLRAQLDSELRLAVFQHRPLRPLEAIETDTARRYVIEPARSRLEALFRDAGIELLVSGHVHQWRSMDVAGVRHIWAPSSWATMPDDYQPVIGDKTVGLVEIDLDRHDEAALVVPSSVVQEVVGVTIPFPYDH